MPQLKCLSWRTNKWFGFFFFNMHYCKVGLGKGNWISPQPIICLHLTLRILCILFCPLLTSCPLRHIFWPQHPSTRMYSLSLLISKPSLSPSLSQNFLYTLLVSKPATSPNLLYLFLHSKKCIWAIVEVKWHSEMYIFSLILMQVSVLYICFYFIYFFDKDFYCQAQASTTLDLTNCYNPQNIRGNKGALDINPSS